MRWALLLLGALAYFASAEPSSDINSHDGYTNRKMGLGDSVSEQSVQLQNQPVEPPQLGRGLISPPRDFGSDPSFHPGHFQPHEDKPGHIGRQEPPPSIEQVQDPKKPNGASIELSADGDRDSSDLSDSRSSGLSDELFSAPRGPTSQAEGDSTDSEDVSMDAADSASESTGFNDADGSQDRSSSSGGTDEPAGSEVGSQVLEQAWVEESDQTVPDEVLEPTV